MSDTIVNFFNYGSYLKNAGILSEQVGLFLPNIAFLRLLRFLKPLGRVRALFASKVVVKTVAGALAGMPPVLALVTASKVCIANIHPLLSF
jgi:hypothetical protein